MLPMEDRASAWFRQRSSHWRDWPTDRLLSSKRRQGLRISVVIPARDEEQTVAGPVPTRERPPASAVLASHMRLPTPEAL
jgi:hypothetical protein